MKNIRPEDVRNAAEQLKHTQADDMVEISEKMAKATPEELVAIRTRAEAQATYELNAAQMLNKQAAISNLSKAHEVSPEDETIADVLRDASEKLLKEDGDWTVSGRLIIEEIVEEDRRPLPSNIYRSSSAEYSVLPAPEAGECSQSGDVSDPGSLGTDAECLQGLKDNPETVRLFQNYVSNADPDSLAALSAVGMSPEMVQTATDMISKMKPEELQKMLQIVSLNGKGPMFPMTTTCSNGNGSKVWSQFPEMTPEMVKMASERLSKMVPQELQKMVEVASSLKANGSPFPMDTIDNVNQRTNFGSQPSVAGRVPSTENPGVVESSSGALFSNSTTDSSSSGLPTSTIDLQENMRNSMKDPAMQQMFASMMQDMSPEMMASMSEQFGVKLSREDAGKDQKAMSSLSPEDFDRMIMGQKELSEHILSLPTM